LFPRENISSTDNDQREFTKQDTRGNNEDYLHIEDDGDNNDYGDGEDDESKLVDGIIPPESAVDSPFHPLDADFLEHPLVSGAVIHPDYNFDFDNTDLERLAQPSGLDDLTDALSALDHMM